VKDAHNEEHLEDIYAEVGY